MKVSLNWLKQYVDVPWSPEELTERLTMLGLEVEGVQRLGGEFSGVVVAEVLTRDPHPNADKLSVCRVQDGSGERQIVCGAQNFKAGDKVPLILPGNALPLKPGETTPFTIKVGKIRGVESHGMMCSPQELGLAADADGLLILKPDARAGQPFADYLGRSGSDVVYDLEVTPNRPDLNSVIGIAREISALTGAPLKHPAVNLPPVSSEEVVQVRVDSPDRCPRYVARRISGVRIGPSPDWLRQSLERVGVRSINNVVDITNYVMLETGQPLHAFDLRRISNGPSGIPQIVVRNASAGESFVTLDQQKRVLTDDMLLIADSAGGIALAGIMGGQNSEIQADTTDVLLESAYFTPPGIRRTAKALALRSEASYRFERGADPECCDWVSLRAASLILQIAGGRLVGSAVDAHPSPATPREISLRGTRLKELLGISINPEFVRSSLAGLGLQWLGPAEGETTRWRVPSWRVDLKREVDLIEEVARLHGVDRIPSTPPRGVVGSHPFDAVFDQLREARNLLTGMGLSECQGQTLIPAGAAEKTAAKGDASVRLMNPLSSDMDVLRPSLIPGLLDTLTRNVSHQTSDLALFEIGRTFAREGERIREQWKLTIVLTGVRSPGFWGALEREATLDAHDLKGVVEEFLERFGVRGQVFQRRQEPTTLFLESAIVALGGKLELGEMGRLQPAVAKAHDLRHPVFLAELNLDLLLSRRNAARSFKPLPHFPASRRDVALLVAEGISHDQVMSAVKQAKASHLENVELFDVFRGNNVPPGMKSLAYAFTYRGSDRTLTDAEINASHEKMVGQLKSTVGATIRA